MYVCMCFLSCVAVVQFVHVLCRLTVKALYKQLTAHLADLENFLRHDEGIVLLLLLLLLLMLILLLLLLLVLLWLLLLVLVLVLLL
jgi:hypothetical protein